MLDDLKIRNKLILLVAIPIVVLIVLAGLGVQSRRDTASNAGSVEDLVAAARANSAVADALQTEALFSTAFVASNRSEEHQASLEEARAGTDAASGSALSHFAANQGTSANFRSAVTLAEDAINKLQYIREAVDQGYEWHQVVETYSALEDTFLAVNDTVSASLADPEVAAQLRTGAALASFKAAIASQGSMLVGAQEGGGLGAATVEGAENPESKIPLLRQAVDRETSQDAILASIADTTRKGEVRDALTSDARITFDGNLGLALRNGQVSTSDELPAVSSTIQADLHEVETALFASLISQAQTIRNDAERAATLFLVTALAAVTVAIAGAIILGRRITRPLDHLTEAADELSSVQMPRLVEWLRNPSDDDMAFELGALRPIEVGSNDEIGKLASSFNEVQRVAGEVAAEQATLLRKGIGEMFVNLARRNQALLDRQIDFIDDLERTEEDPDQLENLYKLDHLATRMRRNAESLLVLAGAEPPRRRGRPAPLANVVRAAVAEVEDFGRIDLLSFDEVLVASNVAADLAHLLSELMENATNFSPPETRVEVVGHKTRADGYVISVSDHGIGMSPDQIEDANQLLAKPPLVGLALSRSLGFIVVGRLSVRHGVTVRLMGSPAGGVTAVVTVPPTLVTDTPGSGANEPSYLEQSAPAAPPAPEGQTLMASPVLDAPTAPVPEPAVGRDGPLSFSPNDGSAPTGPVRRETTEGTDGGLPSRRSASPAPAPAPVAAPAPAAAGDSGLPPRRVPQAPAAQSPPFTPEAPAAQSPPFTPEAPPAPAAEVSAPEPISFTDPGPTDLGNVTLDGPPPPAPSLPARSRPARSSPAADESAEPYFLEESGPPRLFGRSAETPPAPAPAAPAVPAAPVSPSEPRVPAASVPAPAAFAPPVVDRPAPAPPSPGPGPDAGAPSTTSSGLAKRTPRQSSDRVIPGADSPRTAGASRRSPEDVRNLLSGFRAGQARARAEEPAVSGASDQKESDE